MRRVSRLNLRRLLCMFMTAFAVPLLLFLVELVEGFGMRDTRDGLDARVLAEGGFTFDLVRDAGPLLVLLVAFLARALLSLLALDFVGGHTLLVTLGTRCLLILLLLLLVIVVVTFVILLLIDLVILRPSSITFFNVAWVVVGTLGTDDVLDACTGRSNVVGFVSTTF